MPQPEPEPEPEPIIETPPVVESVPEVELPQVEPEKEINITKIGAPEIEGPKILDKIDLSALEKSTRPKSLQHHHQWRSKSRL
ncbi:hypothetical protein MKP07_05975 [Niabella hibiscisoli]|uniref:hypothetical protein n=1 Tax=Niabella hibiscisoli TaxID=1825928 RepID=UPI001F0D6B8C|nr:hypothetical protein [Niabella hibiscisoli]MCH5715771.1 hypothetical protein [Niabella hibiscisoli]